MTAIPPIKEALGLFTSCIKSGESWTPRCEGVLKAAILEYTKLTNAFDFAAHLQRQMEWSEKTFGPGSRLIGVTDHIRRELDEVVESDGALKEWIDVIILGLDGAWRSGATPKQIIEALVAKQTKNEGRTWPDWRTRSENEAIEHDKTDGDDGG